jgi:beta-1,4-N-acetylglucosaminyltransferase
MIFLSVGTQFPFDRLVRAVDEAFDKGSIDGEVFAQIGETSYKPSNIEYVDFLEKEQFDDCVRRATSIISHAGMGIIILALEYKKPLLAMPRLRKYSEVVNDHQVAIARKFDELGHILVAYQENELSSKLEMLKSFTPKPRKPETKAVAGRIAQLLQVLSENTKRF